MNRTLGRSHGLARSEILSVGVNRVAKLAFQDVDNLFVVRVAVRRWDVRARGHSQFEHAYARALRSVDEISDGELANKQGSGLLLSHLMFMLFLTFQKNMIIKDLIPY